MTITVQALLFARYAELVGADRLALSLPDGSRAGDAVSHLRAGHTGGGLPPTVLLAVNGRQSSPDRLLDDGDELAILPPLAGG
ncbi:MAG TPA: MoaD/ThiS family protein [Gemmatimonadales bacterium]|nr:MoaD/ThiS family protein [Gemmatimonadales bacterium]